jgi:hypothetical protein
VEAEGDELQLLGRKNVTVQSYDDWVNITGKEGVLINGGGSYLKVWEGGIEYGTEAGWVVHARKHGFEGARSLGVPYELPEFPKTEFAPADRCVIRVQTKYDGITLDGIPYKLELGGKTYEGNVAAGGVINEELPEGVKNGKLTVFPYGKENGGYEWPLELKTMDKYDTAKGIQSRMKNLGFYDGAIDGDVGPVSEAAARSFHEAKKLATTSSRIKYAGRVRLLNKHDI